MSDYAESRPKAPFNRSGTDFGVRVFTASATSRADAMPNEWDGCFVEMFAADDVHYAFSTNASAAIDFTLAATNGGSSAAAGGILPADTIVRVFIPKISQGETLYFVRDAGGDTSVRITKSSDRL